MKCIQTDDEAKFEEAEETDSEAEDYSKEDQQKLYTSIIQIKAMFEQVYRNKTRQASPSHNFLSINKST